MSVKLTCPKDTSHKEFTVSVPVYQLWLVDETGNYIETDEDCIDASHTPDQYDYYVCKACGSEAKVE